MLSSLHEVIRSAADKHGNKELILYLPGNYENEYRITYSELLQRAKKNSNLLRQIEGLLPDAVVLIHFKDHLDNIEWFWSILMAGYIPTISTPFSHNNDQRVKHILHLNNLLNHPVCITRHNLLPEFAGQDVLKLQTIESFESSSYEQSCYQPFVEKPREANDLAVLMLTSGSTGHAKAVCLNHGQIINAIIGKSRCHETRCSDTFLNWIALDHVASLVESHLHAMYLGASQVHVHAADLLQDPLLFINLLSKHKVAFSFAPNFFLAKLKHIFTKLDDSAQMANKPDLTYLRTLTSGGEANVVETCSALDTSFQRYGARSGVICPGFGMTETCAGSIHNKNCPQNDIAHQREFAALGSCIPGIKMRITDERGESAQPNSIGNLEVTGPIVFTRYYNNPSATANAFTDDGWFKTGDQGFIDSSDIGQLHLVGRTKDTMIINGVKYIPSELESTLDEASINGLTPGFTAVFSSRPKASPTEHIYVVYLPTYVPEDTPSRVETNNDISKITMLQTGVRPHVLPLDKRHLQKSTLGKLSRPKIRTAFEQGEYLSHQTANDEAISSYKAACYEGPASAIEAVILKECEIVFNLPAHDLGVNTSIFEIGVTSIDLIKLKQRLQAQLKLADIPIVTIMTNTTIRSLASALEELQMPRTYDPVVVLQSHGSKTPLWLIHPGVGEVLVFLALAKYMTERPVYALRARGFDGEELFQDVREAVTTYHKAIKAKQPVGPYAIAGYSYGSMLAFEVSKVLKWKDNDEVKFLGAFNLPPHIKLRMQQLDWVECSILQIRVNVANINIVFDTE